MLFEKQYQKNGESGQLLTHNEFCEFSGRGWIYWLIFFNAYEAPSCTPVSVLWLAVTTSSTPSLCCKKRRISKKLFVIEGHPWPNWLTPFCSFVARITWITLFSLAFGIQAYGFKRRPVPLSAREGKDPKVTSSWHFPLLIHFFRILGDEADFI